jgi:hypothetical protein
MGFLIGFLVGLVAIPLITFIALEGEKYGWW